MDWWGAGALALALWVGAREGWWGSLDMSDLHDFALHSARGLLWVAPAAVVVGLIYFGTWAGLPLAVAGLLCGALYWLAYRIPSTLPGLRRGTEIGEVLFGAAIGAALGLGVSI